MRQSYLLSLVFLMTVLSFSIGCNKSSSGGDDVAPAPTMSEQSISPEGCLNLQAIQAVLSSGTFPAFQVTTDFQSDAKLASNKSLFHTYAAFDLKDTSTTDIGYILNPSQQGCEFVYAQTTSGEKLNYKIVANSKTSLTISLEKSQDEALTTYQKDALKEKMQPTRYEVSVMSPTHLRVVMTYNSFDAHCRGKKTVSNKVQTDYFWAAKPSALPSQVEISDSFYQRYLSTLRPDGELPDPLVSNPNNSPDPNAPVPTPGNELPTDGSAPVAPVDPSQPSLPVTGSGPEVPVPQAGPQTPASPGSPVPSEPAAPPDMPSDLQNSGAGIFPAFFTNMQATEVQVSGYVAVPVAEIRHLLTKPVKEELLRCTP